MPVNKKDLVEESRVEDNGGTPKAFISSIQSKLGKLEFPLDEARTHYEAVVDQFVSDASLRASIKQVFDKYLKGAKTHETGDMINEFFNLQAVLQASSLDAFKKSYLLSLAYNAVSLLVCPLAPPAELRPAGTTDWLLLGWLPTGEINKTALCVYFCS